MKLAKCCLTCQNYGKGRCRAQDRYIEYLEAFDEDTGCSSYTLSNDYKPGGKFYFAVVKDMISFSKCSKKDLQKALIDVALELLYLKQSCYQMDEESLVEMLNRYGLKVEMKENTDEVD